MYSQAFVDGFRICTLEEMYLSPQTLLMLAKVWKAVCAT